MSDLPEFAPKEVQQVLPYAKQVFGGKFKRLIPYTDGHFRLVFDPSYFTVAEGNTEPSKSQWGTLKKKMKRHNGGVFVFRDHGKIACEDGNVLNCFYVDFGFFAE